MNKKIISLLVFIITILLQACNTAPQSDNVVKEDDPWNGVRKRYRADGTLLAEVTYKDSIRDGIARNFYANGVVKLEMTYVNGIRHGNSLYYYENGELYQNTPYVDDKKNGVQLKYYPGNILMAEIPFKDDEQIPGIKEYTKEGKMITKEVKINFTLVNRLATDYEFDVLIQLSDRSQHAKFSKLHYDNEGTISGNQPLTAVKGRVTETYFLPPGYSVTDMLDVIAERQTRLGNKEIIKGSYLVNMENKW